MRNNVNSISVVEVSNGSPFEMYVRKLAYRSAYKKDLEKKLEAIKNNSESYYLKSLKGDVKVIERLLEEVNNDISRLSEEHNLEFINFDSIFGCLIKMREKEEKYANHLRRRIDSIVEIISVEFHENPYLSEENRWVKEKRRELEHLESLLEESEKEIDALKCYLGEFCLFVD